MKRFLCVLTAFAVAGPAFAGDASVSVTVGQPGFYGRIDIGNLPPPRVMYAQPIVVAARAGRRRAATDLPARAARTREALGQALPPVQCLRAARLFRAG